MNVEKIKALEEEHEALSDLIRDARKYGVHGNKHAKWFSDMRIVVNGRLDDIERHIAKLVKSSF